MFPHYIDTFKKNLKTFMFSVAFGCSFSFAKYT